MKNTQKIIHFSLIALVVIIVGGSFLFSTKEDKKINNKQTYQAIVTDIMEEKVVENYDIDNFVQTVEVMITNGDKKDEKLDIINDNTLSSGDRVYKEGDKVVLTLYIPEQGEPFYYISDYIRHNALIWLIIIFIIITLAITRWQGLGSLVGMVFSFFVIFKFILPQILNGSPPVLIALIGSLLILPITFYLSHGINKKTNIALLATLITLVITGIASVIFINVSYLTGLSSSEANFLKLDSAQVIDFRGLLLAGIIISVLGILDDITISQSSVVEQLKNTNKSLSFYELYKRSMKVGRDHISSMVNTLVLVYAGASLPLLLLFLNYSEPFLEVINQEFIAKEIIQTLVGSISLILAVPITTLIATVVHAKLKD